MTIAKGRTTLNSYGNAHQKLRATISQRIKNGEVTLCARCNRPILPGQSWDLDHVDGNKTRYDGPAHAYCNRSAGGRIGRARQKRKTHIDHDHDVDYVYRASDPTPETHPNLTFRLNPDTGRVSWYSREWIKNSWHVHVGEVERPGRGEGTA